MVQEVGCRRLLLGVSGGDVAGGLAVDGGWSFGSWPEPHGWLITGRFPRRGRRRCSDIRGGRPAPAGERGLGGRCGCAAVVGRRMIQLDVAGETRRSSSSRVTAGPPVGVVTDADGHDLVVGMLSAADGVTEPRTRWAIPAAALALAWPEVAAAAAHYESARTSGWRRLRPMTRMCSSGVRMILTGCARWCAGRALTMVTGPSGVGKSSLVNAGLIPRLEAEGWAAGAFRPGREPGGHLGPGTRLGERREGSRRSRRMEKWTARILFMGLGDAGARLALALGQPVVLHADQLEEVLDPQVCAPDGEGGVP